MTPYWVEAIKRERAAHGLKPLENTEYYARFILGGMFEAYESWYNSGDDVPFNEIARIVAKAMTRGVNGILEAEQPVKCYEHLTGSGGNRRGF